MTSSLTDLPGEVLEEILLFVPTPRAICRVGITCSSLSEAVSTNERVWNHIYKKRWKHRDSSVETFSYRNYEARHVQDGKTLQLLVQVSKVVEREEDYALGRVFRDPLWEKLLEEQNSFDILRQVAKNDPRLRTLYERTHPISLLTRCLAAQLMDWVYFRKTIKELMTIMNEVHMGSPRGSVVEDCVLLVAESQRKWEDLLGSDLSLSDRIDTTRQKLDDLGRQLQSRIDTCGGNMNPTDVVGMLHRMLLDEMGISVTKEHNNIDYMSVEHVLESRKGLSVTVAAIFQCILRRVGVRVSVSHVSDERLILGLNEETFVDVLRGCVPLSRGALPAQQSNDDDDGPAETKMLRSMIDSAFRCHDETIHNTRSTRAFTAKNKIIALNMMALSPNAHAASHALRISGQFLDYLDPGFFRHYNLINDDTLSRHDEAPFYESDDEEIEW